MQHQVDRYPITRKLSSASTRRMASDASRRLSSVRLPVIAMVAGVLCREVTRMTRCRCVELWREPSSSACTAAGATRSSGMCRLDWRPSSG